MEEFYQIMEQSFPPDEIRSFEGQKALLEKPAYQIWIVGEGQLDGFFAVYEWEDALFIEHFAVRPAIRGKGLGSAALQDLLKKIGKRAYLEVELPENEFARRRIGFYERNGFAFNDYPYYQPALSAEKHPVPLRIMSHGGQVDRETFLRLKGKIYAEVYGYREEK